MREDAFEEGLKEVLRFAKEKLQGILQHLQTSTFDIEEVNFFSYKMDCNNVLQNVGKKANITRILEGAS